MHSKVFQSRMIGYVYTVKCNAPPSYELPRRLFSYFIFEALCLIWTICLCLSISWLFKFSIIFSMGARGIRKTRKPKHRSYLLTHSSESVTHWLTSLLAQLTAHCTQSVHFISHSFICVQLSSKFNKSNWFRKSQIHMQKQQRRVKKKRKKCDSQIKLNKSNLVWRRNEDKIMKFHRAMFQWRNRRKKSGKKCCWRNSRKINNNKVFLLCVKYEWLVRLETS